MEQALTQVLSLFFLFNHLKNYFVIGQVTRFSFVFFISFYMVKY